MSEAVHISVEQARNWCSELLRQRCGLTSDKAQIVAEALVAADLRGVETHGISMMRHYVQQFSRIKTRPMSLVNETRNSAVLDGGDNMGILVSTAAMSMALEKAEKNGLGLVLARNSNHFGTAAHYALMAAKKDMVGLVMTNAVKRLAPWGGLQNIVGNNPFAIAVPGNEFPIVLDMANSVVAYQKIVSYAREGLKLPEGWALDKAGEPTTDAQAGVEGFLMPVGGYKGIGLSVMVDILCGILSQNGTSEMIAELEDYDQARKIGHLFLAIKISDFVEPDVFRLLIDKYVERFHGIPKKEGVKQLYLPGEIEHYRELKNRKDGIPFTMASVKILNDLSDQFDVSRLSY